MPEHNNGLIFVLGTLLLLISASMLIMFLIAYKRRQQKYITERLQMTHQYETQLLQSRLEVQEQAFRHFSEEIHDNVGQLLSLTKMQLHQLSTHCTGQPAERLINQSTELVSQAISDLRSISHTLNSNFIAKAGLIEALQKEAGYINSAKTTSCTIVLQSNSYNLGEDKELLIFRIIQEAIANAIKHAHAKEITITLNYTQEAVTISIQDNGNGFDTAIQSAGLGLNNMQLRAQVIPAAFAITSTPGKGTEVNLTIDKP